MVELSELDVEVVKDYYENHSSSQTEKHFNISHYILVKFLNENNVELHTKTENTKFTNLERYGVENVSQSKENIQKIKETKEKRYGNPNYNNSEKIKQTCLDKYGTPSASGSCEVRKRVEKTNLERYGVANQFQRVNYIKNCCENKYGSLDNFYSYQSQQREKTFIKKYGVKNSSQLASSKLKVKASIIKTCREKYGVDSVTLLPHVRYSSGYSANSKPNKKFAELLRNNNIEFEQEFVIERYSYDFKVGNILIEINPSSTHNSNWSPFGERYIKQKNYHFEKCKLAQSKGYRCICVWDWDDVNKIVNLLKQRDVVYARKCIIKEVNNKEAKEFIDTYHLQNYTKSQINIGLYYNNELLSIMTFGKPRYNGKYQYELLRYCSSTHVIGGAEKLFNYFIKQYNPQSVISYCDLSKFTGDIYKKLGFILKDVTIGKHWYNIKTKKHITNNLLLARGFDQLLGNEYGFFGKGTSNEELMRRFNFIEIYDAGQATYVYEK